MTSPLSVFKFRLAALSFWVVWSLLHTVVLRHFGFAWNVSVWDSLISNALLAITTALIMVILHFYLPKKAQYVFLLGLCFILTISWFLISRSLIVLVLSDNPDYRKFFSESSILRFAFGFLVTGCIALVSVLWYTIADYRETDLRKAEAEKLTRAAELFKLRQQLQPHFLFNSLNSINALIGTQPPQARKMIQQLSDFLRGTLRKEDQQWTTLDEELAHLELYLEIEKVRFGHRLSTRIDNPLPKGTAQLPAMILQPVVENAIEFGLYDTTGEIQISIATRLVQGQLEVEVRNPFDPATATPRKGTGFGLQSVERRLYLLFARNDLLQTATDEQIFITTIKIPQHHDQSDHHR